ncbi:unnamed protein product [Moneuplotes crassus]|uniref:Uncharacterized protein n=2 Tax=Euplotes crassus TaxID=5936 RepID=A0AAD1XY40_EUPCR|nr:unnamed protein product [Moneuplotes crassus]
MEQEAISSVVSTIDKPSFSPVLENSANIGKINKKDRHVDRFSNVHDENELHPDNVEFMNQLEEFNQKIQDHGTLLENNLTDIDESKENTIIDPLFEILQILTSCQEKLNCEACRIGAFIKRVTVPEVRPDMGASEVLQQIFTCFSAIKTQYEAILKFVRKFLNNKYFVSSYINMNRLIKSEIDINDSVKIINKIAIILEQDEVISKEKSDAPVIETNF